MRIRVKDVLDLLAAGVTELEILEDHPDLEPEDIRAVLEYAAAYLDHPVLKRPDHALACRCAVASGIGFGATHDK